MKAHGTHVEMELAADERLSAHEAGAEMRRRVRRAQHLASRAKYGKAEKSLAKRVTLYLAAPAVQANIRALHPSSGKPILVITARDLPSSPVIYP